MNKGLKYRFIFCIFISLLTFYMVTPTLWSLYKGDDEQKPSFLPDMSMQFGLDLKGGVHMVLGVDLDKVVRDQLVSYGNTLEKSLEKAGITGVTTKLLPERFELEVISPNEETKNKVSAEMTKNFSVLEFVGESGNTLVTKVSSQQENYIRTRAIDQSIETVRNRIDEYGVSEPVIARKGDSQILVQFPGAKDPERLKTLIGQTAKLMFRIVHECTDMGCVEKQHADIGAKILEVEAAGKYTRDSFDRFSLYRDRVNQDLKDKIPANTEIFFEKDRDPNQVGKFIYKPYLLSTKDVLSGEYIKDAYSHLSKGNGMMSQERPVVLFEMNSVGAPMLAQLTTEFKGRLMAIVLDDLVKSAPVIQSTISDSGQISLGSGNIEQVQQEAHDTAIVLRAGALPASIEVQEERVIGPSMGRDAIEAGKISLVLATIIVFIFMWGYYGAAGLVANFVTLVNVLMIFSILGSLKATLTLPGIAGIVLTIGMAVDALIIIYERMREELRAGRVGKKMIDYGFDKAFSTILDSNITTLIGAFVLLNYGTGSIRGFAFTLIVGIGVNVFLATYFSKILFHVFFENSKTLTLGLSRKELAGLNERTV
ncbi:MAG: protein translocase subunit SecD [Proteobacteria bacterium]|nr:protein translocase subunit SecD [Pseudomonadota bacterium]